MTVKGLWVIDQGGLCLYQRSYGIPFIDKDQFSGMFTALYNFSAEITKEGMDGGKPKTLELFKWDRYYFTIEVKRGFFFLLCSENAKSSLRSLFNIFEDAFFSIFRNQLLLLGDMLRNSPESQIAKKKLDNVVDEVIRDQSREEKPCRIIQLQEAYRGNVILEKLIKEHGLSVMAVLFQCDGKASMKEIADETQIPEADVQKILAALFKSRLIRFTEPLTLEAFEVFKR